MQARNVLYHVHYMHEVRPNSTIFLLAPLAALFYVCCFTRTPGLPTGNKMSTTAIYIQVDIQLPHGPGVMQLTTSLRWRTNRPLQMLGGVIVHQGMPTGY
ncbi:hypothetical protein BU24DRAFT_489090 [Aaosphaeria arxii CBS 175.79]|uniref:Uncharacterized protein n=1 Tax=Aaosphaeria arxii CBS 175.79 TaxID=1450172 RepID=A0A6A5Y2D6_9PLEO|nr:uncharacterized protein BU24DRAFT_489090 [Aaosphaeria arxii CBS 175.79]KAF2019051.1 hypothetical protein BU24DRAFT_489090 [Aaosphaeria arxii CBS 175.79]